MAISRSGGFSGSTVTDEFIYGSVELIGPGLQCEARDPLARPPKFRRGVERDNLEFPYGVLRERDIAKVSGPLGGTANKRAIELKLVARALAAIDGGVQHAGRAAPRYSPPRHAWRPPAFGYPKRQSGLRRPQSPVERIS